MRRLTKASSVTAAAEPMPMALFEKTCWKMYHSLTTVEFPGPPDVIT